MRKKTFDSDTKKELKEMKVKLSSEVGMEYNDEIYKGHRILSNGYIPLNYGGKLIKNIIEAFERKFNK